MISVCKFYSNKVNSLIYLVPDSRFISFFVMGHLHLLPTLWAIFIFTLMFQGALGVWQILNTLKATNLALACVSQLVGRC